MHKPLGPQKDELSATTTALRHHVQWLAEEIGERNLFHPEALAAAAEYLTTFWQGLGYTVQPQEYTVAGISSANLEVSISGQRQPKHVILIGAHYDSVAGSPGANDNGSGVASLLEMSRLLAKTAPGRTLRFVAFTNEEPPLFMTRNQGSMRYAREIPQRGEDIRLMISLETMGYYRDEPGSQAYPPLFRYFYPNRGNFIALVANFRSRKMMRQLAHAFRDRCDFPLETTATFAALPGVAWSDHLSFWLRGYRALMVTDTAFYRYPYYHTPKDTAENLDYDSLARVTHGLAEALLVLADSDHL